MDATFAALYFGVALQVHNIVNFNVNSLSYSWSSVISIIYLLFLSHFITFCFLETFVLALFSLLFQQAEFFIQLCFSRIGMSQPILYSRQKFPCFAFFSVPVFLGVGYQSSSLLLFLQNSQFAVGGLYAFHMLPGSAVNFYSQKYSSGSLDSFKACIVWLCSDVISNILGSAMF